MIKATGKTEKMVLLDLQEIKREKYRGVERAFWINSVWGEWGMIQWK